MLESNHRMRLMYLLHEVDLHTTEDHCVKVRAMFKLSTVSFISESLCQTLRLTQQCANLQIHCSGNNITYARAKVSLRLCPLATNLNQCFRLRRTFLTLRQRDPRQFGLSNGGHTYAIFHWRIQIQRVANRFSC